MQSIYPPQGSAIGDITGLGAGVETALGEAVTGSGSVVLATQPSIVSPTISGTDGNWYSSSYTPAITNGTNVASSTALAQSYFTRVGDDILYNIPATLSFTGVGAFDLEISLPVASNFAIGVHCQGSGMTTIGAVGAVTGTQHAWVTANTTNDTLQVYGYADATAGRVWNFSGRYRII